MRYWKQRFGHFLSSQSQLYSSKDISSRMMILSDLIVIYMDPNSAPYLIWNSWYISRKRLLTINSNKNRSQIWWSDIFSVVTFNHATQKVFNPYTNFFIGVFSMVWTLVLASVYIYMWITFFDTIFFTKSDEKSIKRLRLDFFHFFTYKDTLYSCYICYSFTEHRVQVPVPLEG